MFSSILTVLQDVAHGHGHEHGDRKMELPDYKQWKIEGTPVKTVQKKLAAGGNVSFVGTLLQRLKWEFAAFVVAVGAEYYLESQNKDKKHH
uniref:NADH dehydrogenase [ubiquinone] 1 beta subcomplex subunit 3 n=1 Tax=Colobus angolensis palliatus TaxID=336983 RepID=A0A2K5K3F4_COLAP